MSETYIYIYIYVFKLVVRYGEYVSCWIALPDADTFTATITALTNLCMSIFAIVEASATSLKFKSGAVHVNHSMTLSSYRCDSFLAFSAFLKHTVKHIDRYGGFALRWFALPDAGMFSATTTALIWRAHVCPGNPRTKHKNKSEVDIRRLSCESITLSTRNAFAQTLTVQC